jgi:hypothetical protein
METGESVAPDDGLIRLIVTPTAEVSQTDESVIGETAMDSEPDPGTAADQPVRAVDDPVRAFADERLVIDPGARVDRKSTQPEAGRCRSLRLFSCSPVVPLGEVGDAWVGPGGDKNHH